MSQDLITQIYQQFSVDPLTSSQSDLYVELSDVRGGKSIVDRLANRILRSRGPLAQVLAGHRGSGKSTELNRLKKLMESKSPKHFVVVCNAEDDLDRNDVDIHDILIALIRQTAKALRDELKVEMAQGYFRAWFDRINSGLSTRFEFDSIKLEAGFFKLGAAMKSSPDFRAEVRKLVEPDTNSFLFAANEFLSDVNKSITAKGYAGLIVLVDDLDKMTIRPHANAGCNTAEYLFVQRAAQLTALQCHTVYTMPLSLAYSHHEATIKMTFGGHVPVVPMVKVATAPPNSKPFREGISRMRAIVAARLSAADTTIEQIFDKPKTLTELIKLSGGQPTELMAMMQDVLPMSESELPITMDAVKQARREGQREYARQLRREYWPIIEEVRKTGQAVRDLHNEGLIRELLDCRAILQYVNDDEWYGLNPMVAQLTPPAPLPPTVSPVTTE